MARRFSVSTLGLIGATARRANSSVNSDRSANGVSSICCQRTGGFDSPAASDEIVEESRSTESGRRGGGGRGWSNVWGPSGSSGVLSGSRMLIGGENGGDGGAARMRVQYSGFIGRGGLCGFFRVSGSGKLGLHIQFAEELIRIYLLCILLNQLLSDEGSGRGVGWNKVPPGVVLAIGGGRGIDEDGGVDIPTSSDSFLKDEGNGGGGGILSFGGGGGGGGGGGNEDKLGGGGGGGGGGADNVLKFGGGRGGGGGGGGGGEHKSLGIVGGIGGGFVFASITLTCLSINSISLVWSVCVAISLKSCFLSSDPLDTPDDPSSRGPRSALNFS